VSVEFAEAVCSSGVSEGEVRLTPLLFDRAGLALTKQLLELTQVLAESTAASSPTVNEQAATTHRLLCCVAGQLGDDRICAELLQPVRRVFAALSCALLKLCRLRFLCPADAEGRRHSCALLLDEAPQVPALPGLHRGPAAAPRSRDRGRGGGQCSGHRRRERAAHRHPAHTGEAHAVWLTYMCSSSHLLHTMSQLCVGSLSPTVSPQDTLTALEGLIQLSEQHRLFSMNWFQHQCWGSLLTPCLKVPPRSCAVFLCC
jgi:hypothetical protein